MKNKVQLKPSAWYGELAITAYMTLGIVKKIGRIGANYCMWAMKMAQLCQM